MLHIYIKLNIHTSHSKNKIFSSLIIENFLPMEEKSNYFIWSQKEALLKQHEQTARSACGASAIINVLVNI